MPTCGILGLPMSVASTVPSMTHLISLTTYEEKRVEEGKFHHPLAAGLLAVHGTGSAPSAQVGPARSVLLHGDQFADRKCFVQSDVPMDDLGHDQIPKLPFSRRPHVCTARTPLHCHSGRDGLEINPGAKPDLQAPSR